MNATVFNRFNYSPVKVLKAIGHGLHKIEHIPTRHQKMLEQRYKQIAIQMIILFGFLPLAWSGTLVVNWLWPNFFVYPYFNWELPSLAAVKSFWPLFAWLAFLIVFGGNSLRSSHLDWRLWKTGMISGNLAGIWEEIGFRFIFICYSMLTIVVYNWLLSTFAWVVVGALALFTLATLIDDDHSKIGTFMYGVVTVFTALMLTPENPVIWFYLQIMMPVINFISFDSYAVIFNNPESYQPLFVMGAILANARFRDGHKYQGWFGYMDSWIVGFVFLYAMLIHGLITAIVLHCIWNTCVYTSNLLKRRLFG